MDALKPLEKWMDEYLVKKAPWQIPEGGRKWIAKYSPVIVLVIAILSVIALIALFTAINTSKTIVDTLNTYYGAEVIHYGALYYISLLALVVQIIILFMAYTPLKQKVKKGWDLLLLGSVISLVFSILYVFTDSGSVGGFIGDLVGTLIGLYILAQIKSQYTSKEAKKADK